MKKLLMAAAIATATIPGHARAQSAQMIPNGSGGYNTYSSDGTSTQVIPNGSGGYNTYSSDGTSTQMIPNGSDGYNIYGQ
jgi:hypothetical protein